MHSTYLIFDSHVQAYIIDDFYIRPLWFLTSMHSTFLNSWLLYSSIYYWRFQHSTSLILDFTFSIPYSNIFYSRFQHSISYIQAHTDTNKKVWLAGGQSHNRITSAHHDSHTPFWRLKTIQASTLTIPTFDLFTLQILYSTLFEIHTPIFDLFTLTIPTFDLTPLTIPTFDLLYSWFIYSTIFIHLYSRPVASGRFHTPPYWRLKLFKHPLLTIPTFDLIILVIP